MRPEKNKPKIEGKKKKEQYSEANRDKIQFLKQNCSKVGINMIKHLGRNLEKVIQHLKEGIIFVFPNMYLLEICHYTWFEVFNYQLGNDCEVFLQTRSRKDNSGLVQEYKQSIKKDGKAILFATSKGDFLDHPDIKESLNRVIFMIGKPGWDYSDGYVQEKMEYIKQNQTEVGGEEWHWYNDYTVRQVNRIIGKSIRNQNDYGAVFLVDDVYIEKQWIRRGIMEWAKSFINIDSNIDNFILDVQNFFKANEGPRIKYTQNSSEVEKPPIQEVQNNFDEQLQISQITKKSTTQASLVELQIQQ